MPKSFLIFKLGAAFLFWTNYHIINFLGRLWIWVLYRYPPPQYNHCGEKCDTPNRFFIIEKQLHASHLHFQDKYVWCPDPEPSWSYFGLSINKLWSKIYVCIILCSKVKSCRLGERFDTLSKFQKQIANVGWH